jgi:hypothetical protein
VILVHCQNPRPEINFTCDWCNIIQGDQKVSVHLMITVQKTCKNILNSFNHLPW